VRRARRVLIAGVVPAAALLALVLSDLPARWLVLEDVGAVADAAVVMAGDPDYERTATAARLVLAGQARLLLLTGGEPGPGDSAESLRERAIALGVPPAAIRTESTSRSTREAVLALAPVLERERVRSVILVTSPFHQRRAFLAARNAWKGIAIRNRPAQPSFWSPHLWWRDRRSREAVWSEYQKLLYYAVRGWLAEGSPQALLHHTRPNSARTTACAFDGKCHS